MSKKVQVEVQFAGEKLVRGRRYETAKLRFAGWTGPSEHLANVDDTYDCWVYFTDGTYLGPDKHGVEPLFVRVDGAADEVRVEIDKQHVMEYRNTLFDDERVLECDPDGFVSPNRDAAIGVLERYRLKGKIVPVV